jgi:MFS family permease
MGFFYLNSTCHSFKIYDFCRMKKTYSASFWILCAHMLLFFVSFNLLVPELNDYLTSLGGEDLKWLILGLWTLSAGITRPFSGKIADNFGRKNVIFIGVIISIVISFLYPFFIGITGFLILRFLHGFSTGFQPTGATALIGDFIPKGKRGEAMGIFSMTISIGFGIGSWLSTSIFQMFEINGLFFASGLFGLIALSLTFFIKEEKPPKIDISFANILPKANEIFAPEVIQPTIIMFITAMQAGIYYLIVPDFSTQLGIEEKGMFWLYFTVTSLATRFFAGKAVDKYGYRRNIAIGLILEIISGYICMQAETPFEFFTGAALFGFGGGMITPAIFTWTTDLANPKFKGRGIGTMFIALEFGIAIGGFLAQEIYDNQIENFKYAFLTGIILCSCGLIYLYFGKKIETKKTIKLS